MEMLMSLLSMIQDQFRQMEWADALVWKNVFASEATCADDTLRSRLHHMHLVQHAFLAVWQHKFTHASQQELMEWSKRGSELRGIQLMNWGKTFNREVQQYLAGLSETVLTQPAVLPWAEMVAATLGKTLVVPSMAEALLQVIMHTAHHRGQINARLRELGNEPPLVDFIAWVWLGKPAAEWQP
jgi:uncharacterized damage-inducible protein DinB